jgi:YacP-like NYN domain-containing protein
MLYLVDGFNFLHAVLLVGSARPHWWRLENQQRVVDWCMAAGVVREGVDLWIVFDQREGREQSGSGGGALVGGAGVQIHHAPDADDYIVARCGELCSERDVVVVSADRSLVDRAKHRGARASSPWAFARDASSSG